MEKLLAVLTPANLLLAAVLRRRTGHDRRLGHVKAADMKKAEARYTEIEAALFAPAQALQAAE